MSTQEPKIGRRRMVLSTLALGAAYGLGLGSREIYGYIKRLPYERASAAVLPETGTRTGLVLGEVIARLAAGGAVAPEKLAAVYERRGGMPDWMARALKGEDSGEIELGAKTVPYLLNLFWPLGIANKAAFNQRHPIAEKTLPRLAATGGWTLGIEKNGATYYNKVEAVPLTEEQDAMVERMAGVIYRPCCDNAALFPDCNHGAAMLGFLQLAAAQNLPEERIWELAKILNGFWYPNQYVSMALMFDLRDGQDWDAVPAQTVLDRKHSSISGWRRNVNAELSKLVEPSDARAKGGGNRGGSCSI
ncbi:MAG: hypothetical protein OEY16_08620 [Alphaproteobacteria bacterium]|nr:hypothetical protein [Alphaproteobacteria bacterium]